MSTTNRPSDFGHSSKDALRDADLNAVTGGVSDVMKAFGQALQAVGRGGGGSDAPTTTTGAGARGTGGQIGP